ncbi:MAG: TIGR03000 domain-containing protein [Fimbriiglobus sp.]|jgi:uncharacterized protein (TIGR03000 family)|nr:TIGR03000 domain-containing protein [Fimbriiglobus sp.]
MNSGYGSCFGSTGPVYYGPDFHQGSSYTPITGSGIVPDGLGRADMPMMTLDRSKETLTAQAKPQAAPARLTIELPADAKLYVDGVLVKGATNSRNFHTPDLPTGKSFYYDLKAEMVVDGETVTEEKRVVVKAGDAANESFVKLIAAANKAKNSELVKK